MLLKQHGVTGKIGIGLRMGLRVVGAVVGGYALTTIMVATAGAVLARLGMARSEAVVVAAMFGFIAFLALLLWAFSVVRVARLWTVYASGAAALAGLLWLVK